MSSDKEDDGDGCLPKESADGTPEYSEKKKRKRKRKRRKKNPEDDDDDEDPKDSAIETVEQPLDPRVAECDRTVFVEGIPYTATPDDVRGFFAEHKLHDITDCRLPVWQDTGRLRGYGHVVFASIESQQTAVSELSGRYLQNRYLTIQAARRPRDPSSNEVHSEPSKTILLNNLSYDATEEDIQAVLEQYGTIVSGGVRVVRNSVTHQSKGFCYVEFEDVAAAKAAMQNRIVIIGRPCRMDYDHGRMKGSFRTATGRLWQKEHGKPSNYGKRLRQSRQTTHQPPSNKQPSG